MALMNDFDSKNSKIMRDVSCGTLYVVSTPIGNMEDITIRALSILKGVDLIAAESVAHTRGLCAHYNIKTRVTRFNQHNGKVKAPELIRYLQSGKSVAVVTDAGTPGISDPGLHLISQAAEQDISISPIPGPSAVTAALSVAGFPSEQFVFVGFLPPKSAKRKRSLLDLASEHRTIVFYEAPHRVREMLADLLEILGNRQMVMFRELTKVFEDIKRGTVSDVLAHLTPDRVRGEFTLVIAGETPRKAREACQDRPRRITDMLDASWSIKDIAELISNEAGISYRQAYKECIAIKRQQQMVNG